MRKPFIYLVLLLFSISLQSSDRVDLLPECRYLEFYDKKVSFQDIKNIDENRWKKTDKRFINFSYRPNLEIWLRCKYKNETNALQRKILELQWPHLGYVTLYDRKTEPQGTLLLGKSHNFFTPRFTLKFSPHEQREFFLSVNSPLSALLLKPVLWEESAFKKYEISRFVIYALFFGALLALLVYNFFIYFFTKDKTYLWYCAYLAGVLIHQAYYTGFLEYFILQKPIEHRLIVHLIIAASLIFIPPFARSFLQTEKYMPRADKILKYMPLYIAISSLVPDAKMMLAFLIPLSVVFLVIVFSALVRDVIQARYFAVGWACVVTSMALMGLYNLGYFGFLSNFPYIVQVGIAAEALIFSIGLADRINRLKAEKAAADALLIKLQTDEKKRLEKMVEKRTKQLLKALEEKDILFKELNHRVKNNMQMIVSLLRLQSGKIADSKARDVLETMQNRIGSIGKLHELLYQKREIEKVDTASYFSQIVQEIQKSFPNSENIEIVLNIQADLDMTKAIYCGLIVNELVTNSMKHAFDEKGGKIWISLYQQNGKFILSIKDDGKGFEFDQYGATAGLLIVRTLAQMQLKGKIEVFTSNGSSFLVIF